MRQAYYQPNAHRMNLIVLVAAHVTRIASRHNDDGTITATGVAFAHGGNIQEVHASKEVLLAAGCVIDHPFDSFIVIASPPQLCNFSSGRSF